MFPVQSRSAWASAGEATRLAAANTKVMASTEPSARPARGRMITTVTPAAIDQRGAEWSGHSIGEPKPTPASRHLLNSLDWRASPARLALPLVLRFALR